jgi:hypothetical protein
MPPYVYARALERGFTISYQEGQQRPSLLPAPTRHCACAWSASKHSGARWLGFTEVDAEHQELRAVSLVQTTCEADATSIWISDDEVAETVVPIRNRQNDMHAHFVR